MEQALSIFAIINLVILLGYAWLRWYYSYWHRKGVPFLRPFFPFGNYAPMFLQQKSLSELIIELYNSSTEPLLGLYVLIQPTLMVRDPRIIRDILTKEFSSFSSRGTYTNEDIDAMSNNLVLQNGDKWRQNRQRLTPAFTSNKLKGMFETIVNCGSSLHKYIEKYAESGETIEIREIFARYATNVIASVAFGIDINCIENPKEEFRHYGARIFEPTAKNMFRFNLAFLYPGLAKFLRLRFTDKEVGDFMIETVRQNAEYRESNNVMRKDFFQLLLQLRNTGEVHEDDDWSAKATSDVKSMSLEEMAAQAYVFFAASFESSSTTMSFCMYELAKNPDEQNKVRDEINQVLETHGGQLTYESISEMKYLEKCIDETLRMHPPFGFIARKCTKEYKVPDTNIVIDEGTSIVIPVSALHYDPKYFEEPFKFIPERFDEKVIANKTFVDTPKPYLPFGDGPRICLGLRLAKLQSKIAIVLLLSKFHFELDAQHVNTPLKIDPRCIAKLTVGGINLKVKSN